MTQLEEKIIRNIKMTPDVAYGYKSYKDALVAIAKAMDYKVVLHYNGTYTISNIEEFEKSRTILKRMIAKGILIENKRGGLVKFK